MHFAQVGKGRIIYVEILISRQSFAHLLNIMQFIAKQSVTVFMGHPVIE